MTVIAEVPNVDVKCEAIECERRAETVAEVQVGHIGTITLSLCKSCVSKFEGIQTIQNIDDKIKITSGVLIEPERQTGPKEPFSQVTQNDP